MCLLCIIYILVVFVAIQIILKSFFRQHQQFKDGDIKATTRPAAKMIGEYALPGVQDIISVIYESLSLML